jgi:hypothetical protein
MNLVPLGLWTVTGYLSKGVVLPTTCLGAFFNGAGKAGIVTFADNIIAKCDADDLANLSVETKDAVNTGTPVA